MKIMDDDIKKIVDKMWHEFENRKPLTPDEIKEELLERANLIVDDLMSMKDLFDTDKKSIKVEIDNDDPKKLNIEFTARLVGEIVPIDEDDGAV